MGRGDPRPLARSARRRRPRASRVRLAVPRSSRLPPASILRSRRSARTATRMPVPSRTMTRTKVKLIKPEGPGVTTNSSFRLSRAPGARERATKLVGAPNAYLTNVAQSQSCLEGYQHAFTNVWSSFIDLQYIRNRIAGNTVPPVPGTIISNQYVLASMIGETVYTNATLASCELELYDIVRKRNANPSVSSTIWPEVAWDQGLMDAEQNNAPNPSAMLKSSPFDSPEFKQFFKVVRRTRVQLVGGGTHRHSVVLKPNMLINEALLNYAAGDLQGLTVYTMARFYGQPVSADQSGSPQVTTAAIKIDCVQTLRYKYTWSQDITNNVYVQDNLLSLTGEKVITSQSVQTNAQA